MCSTRLNSPRRMVRADRNVKEIIAPNIEEMSLDDCGSNTGYKAGSIAYEIEIKMSTTSAASTRLQTQ